MPRSKLAFLHLFRAITDFFFLVKLCLVGVCFLGQSEDQLEFLFLLQLGIRLPGLHHWTLPHTQTVFKISPDWLKSRGFRGELLKKMCVSISS
jgi:hypothetical protein